MVTASPDSPCKRLRCRSSSNGSCRFCCWVWLCWFPGGCPRETPLVAYDEATIDEVYYLAQGHANRGVGLRSGPPRSRRVRRRSARRHAIPVLLIETGLPTRFTSIPSTSPSNAWRPPGHGRCVRTRGRPMVAGRCESVKPFPPTSPGRIPIHCLRLVRSPA